MKKCSLDGETVRGMLTLFALTRIAQSHNQKIFSNDSDRSLSRRDHIVSGSQSPEQASKLNSNEISVVGDVIAQTGMSIQSRRDVWFAAGLRTCSINVVFTSGCFAVRYCIQRPIDSMATAPPTIKIEGPVNVKMEDADSPGSLASEQFMDDVEDDPELNTVEAQKALWMARFPPWLWTALEHANDDEEIDLGTIRVEGALDNPERVSLLLNSAPFSRDIEKEYVLKMPSGPAELRKIKREGASLMFSEKNKPGYKQKEMYWDEEGPGRSVLYDQMLREQKKKDRKDEGAEEYREYVPKPIPKITALAGTFLQEFECEPVNNEEHRRLAALRQQNIREKEPEQTQIVDRFENKLGSSITNAQKKNIQRVSTLEMLIRMILTSFRTHKLSAWRLRRTVPPDQIQIRSERPFSMPSAGISIGVYETFALSCMNLNQLSKRSCRMSQICIVLATSTVNGSSSPTTRLTTVC